MTSDALRLADLEQSAVEVDGATIRYRRLRPSEPRPPLLLVHGGGANAAWWLGMIEDLSASHDVILPELSGHGDSDHRGDAYRPELWADELAAVILHAAIAPTTVVGHSMGGFVTLFLLARHPELATAAILVDSGVRPPSPGPVLPRGRERAIATRVSPDRETLLQRFRLVPEQPVTDPSLVRRIAQESIRRVDGGWTWKFDPQVFQRFSDAAIDRAARATQVPVGLIYGEHSPGCGPETVEYLENALARVVPSRVVTGAYHHVPVDEPDRCRTALMELLSELASLSARPEHPSSDRGAAAHDAEGAA